MSANQQVGKTVAAFLLVLVAEAQSRVSVNVRLDTPDSGREEITGHIVGDTFVPGLAAPASRLLPGLLPSGLYTQASLFARSKGSTDDANIPGELIPRSSPRWLPCRSSKWIKDCKEGSIVVGTLKRITEQGCEWFCNQQPECKTYVYMKDEEEGSNCALTSATEGTSLTNGISGPDLPLNVPAVNRARSKGPAEGTEDCSEFHFRDCSHEELKDIDDYGVEVDGTTWQFKRGLGNVWDCAEECGEGARLNGTCNSFAFMPDDTEKCSKETDQNGEGCRGKCGAHANSQVDHLIRKNCKVVSGRVDPNQDDGEKYDSCRFFYNMDMSNENGCRRGYCNLDHYGEPFDEEAQTDEQRCKEACFSYDSVIRQRCTHYQYHRIDKKCSYYQVDTTKSVQYSCFMHAADKLILDHEKGDSNRSVINDLHTCVQDVKTIGEGGGGITTEGPGSISTTNKEGPGGFCSGNPCKNGGLCQSNKCFCADGWTGLTCEDRGSGHSTTTSIPATTTIGCQLTSEWSEWSECTYNRGVPSQQERTRTKVDNGKDCPTIETKFCQYKCASCPEGFIPDKEGKFGCFHFGGENQLMDWNEAKEFCSGLHQSSRLVEPFSKDMIDAIGAIFPYESPVPGGYRPDNYTGLGWIGAYQDAGGKPWKWASTGSVLTPEDMDWRAGEPNSDFENCVELVKTDYSQWERSGGRVGQWNDLYCSGQKRYPICHYPCNAAKPALNMRMVDLDPGFSPFGITWQNRLP